MTVENRVHKSPTFNDLSVYRQQSDDLLEVFEVRSWLTRGRCATVYRSRSNPERMRVQP